MLSRLRSSCLRLPVRRFQAGFHASCVSRALILDQNTAFKAKPLRDPTKLVTPEEAVSVIKSNNNVYVQMAAAAPQRLMAALPSLKGKVKNVKIHHLHLEGKVPHLDPDMEETFRDNSFFIGANVRKAVQAGRSDYTPIFFSEIPLLFRRNILPLDVALVSVSPPDKHGWCSLGLSVDTTLAAVQNAKHVVAQINKNMPRTHGDGLIHIKQFDTIIEGDDPIVEHKGEALDEPTINIGKHVASLVPDGATLQMGIGSIPDAVLSQLYTHKDLGIHTEMFADGLIPLVENGVVNNRVKKIHPGKIISTFLVGSKKLYDFVDDNPQVHLLDVAYVNDPYVISRNPRVHAINSAIEVDITGQVCADSIGFNFFSGVGGQMDFMRGAAMSEHGKPIIALPSVTSKGESRIVAALKQGAGVVTTRAHVHYVVTEYGIAEMFGKTVRQRAVSLAKIAHPKHREGLKAHIAKLWGNGADLSFN